MVGVNKGEAAAGTEALERWMGVPPCKVFSFKLWIRFSLIAALLTVAFLFSDQSSDRLPGSELGSVEESRVIPIESPNPTIELPATKTPATESPTINYPTIDYLTIESPAADSPATEEVPATESPSTDDKSKSNQGLHLGQTPGAPNTPNQGNSSNSGNPGNSGNSGKSKNK